MPEGRAGRCVGAGVSRGAKSHTAQIDKHQSDVCTLLHASLSLLYVSISTPCDFLYYLQFRTYFLRRSAPARLHVCAMIFHRHGPWPVAGGLAPRRRRRGWGRAEGRAGDELGHTVTPTHRRGTAGASTHHRAGTARQTRDGRAECANPNAVAGTARRAPRTGRAAIAKRTTDEAGRRSEDQ